MENIADKSTIGKLYYSYSYVAYTADNFTD